MEIKCTVRFIGVLCSIRKKMTAKDLLYKYLDYNYIWSGSGRIKDKPSIIRRQQIEALLSAFGLSKKYIKPLIQIKYSIFGKKGELNRSKYLNKLTDLHDRPYEDNQDLANKAIDRIKEIYKNIPGGKENEPVDFGWMYNNLLNFRQEIYNVSCPNEGMLEGFSVGLIYSHYLQSELKKIINKNLDEIDDTLWLILDPTKKEIDLEILISEFNYPDVDLEAVDLDWTIENY